MSTGWASLRRLLSHQTDNISPNHRQINDLTNVNRGLGLPPTAPYLYLTPDPGA
jgi:hypothetical protein